MENAQSASSAAGSGDRRRTVSGALPDLFQGDDDKEDIDAEPVEIMKFPWSSPSSPTLSSHPVSPGRSNTHKKGLSSNVLSKFNILRDTKDENTQTSGDNDDDAESFKPRKSTDDDGEPSSPISPVKVEHALTAALKPTKTRKRKGSLRKTALLGGKRLGAEGRERKNSLLQRSPSSKQSSAQGPHHPSPISIPPVSHDLNNPSRGENRDASRVHRRYSQESPNAVSDSSWTEPTAVSAAKLSLVTDHKTQQGLRIGSNDLGSPLDLKSATSQTSYASTTDDDDVLTFDRPANSYTAQQRESMLLKPHSSPAVGYFPVVASVSGVSRRRSSKQSRSSPLSHSITALSSYPEPEPHDYTETEYWGWVILFVTWLTFAVGMGSCLEIWSWAWDVGETPYAPPELEDDPTLPIVGYYPALIVLTGVVAWIWITVSWVGMKYFRHAKIEV